MTERKKPSIVMIGAVVLLAAAAAIAATALPLAPPSLVFWCTSLGTEIKSFLVAKVVAQVMVVALLAASIKMLHRHRSGTAVLTALIVFALLLSLGAALVNWFATGIALELSERSGGGDPLCPADWRRNQVVPLYWASPAFAFLADAAVALRRRRSEKMTWFPWVSVASLIMQLIGAGMLLDR